MTDLSILESQEDLVQEICDLRKQLNDALGGLEKRVRNEWERIYQEEHIKKALSTSMVRIHRNIFLQNINEPSHLTFYTTKCVEMCTVNETALFHVEINPKLKSVLTIPRGDMASLMTKRKDGNIYATERFKLLKDCKACVRGVFEIKDLDGKEPGFVDLVVLSETRFVLLDFENYRCCLVDMQSGQVISHYALSCQALISACIVGDNKVAVSMCDEEQMLCVVQLFTVADCFITPAMKIVLREYDWSIITLEGRENIYKEFDGHIGENFVTSMAINAFKSRLFISVHDDNSLYCVGIDDDNLYVVGSDSDNVFQISPDGDVLQIITEGIPSSPFRIRFTTAGERSLLTN
ncbi:hypothetical protein CHS0354_000951 [Potamilus streckersoni]|uniref:Uncharacterized protein n=1 Tax=Potamilus streckersoni TaxID=2493646 RepID=A0AAE0SUC1_9BIVA|nr:hypothetical protein CHS0354_000951 [Potamilus streckersoni]